MRRLLGGPMLYPLQRVAATAGLAVTLAATAQAQPAWVPTELGVLPGSPRLADAGARAINDVGQVVGWGETATGARHAFLWTAAGGMVDLGTLGGIASRASGINDAGQVVGRFSFGFIGFHALLWRPREDLAIDFGSTYGALILAGTTWTQLHGLSPLAMVAGDLDGNGSDDLVLNLGPGIGVYAWMNHATWT